MKQAGKILTRLLISAVIIFLIAYSPLFAQIDPSAYVEIGGHRLFEVKRSGVYSAEQRAKEANQVLEDLIEQKDFVSNTVPVEIDTSRELPIIRVNGAHFLTVTAQDTPQGRNELEQALHWSNELEKGIKQAQYERTNQYLIRTILISITLITFALLLTRQLGKLWQRWVEPRLPKIPQTPSSPSFSLHPPTDSHRPLLGIRLLANLFLYILRSLVWIGVVLYIIRLFPQTRFLSQKAYDITRLSFFSDLLPLGNQSYSILDLFILAGFIICLVVIGRGVKQILRSRVLSLTGLNRGSQDAIALMANYTFIFIGTIVILQIWGLDLSSLTVFASVLGVGIGLGLQGIAREFVSGLVLIFERPIQVGDFVEVGTSMGTVERIGVRSTEIRTLDQIAIILPNSRFLESEVINWSHPSPISRLRIGLGVAYGSNLTLVRQILIEAAKKHPEVLGNPSPEVFFSGFGDSSLDFYLLIWIARPYRQFKVKSDLYFDIYAQFQNHHVSIPFPQRDLHLRSSDVPVVLSPELIKSLNTKEVKNQPQNSQD